jgi:Tfp pilus assembly protein PilZ
MTSSDARWGARMTIDQTVRVRAQDGERSAQMQDLSLTGCFLETAFSYAIGSMVSLTFHLVGDATKSLAAEARVVRRTARGVGVRFVFTDPETPAAIKRWVSSRGTE